jgi:2-polyprenyl-6-methoxyphenol hydroxylase-like FAD-dependent oxidoreductase
VTTTPLQALSLSNNVFVWRMSNDLANRVRKEAGDAPPDQVRRAWQLSLGREPDETERSKATVMIAKHGLRSLCRALFNSSEFVVIE